MRRHSATGLFFVALFALGTICSGNGAWEGQEDEEKKEHDVVGVGGGAGPPHMHKYARRSGWNSGTQPAVELALGWIRKRQTADGSWHVEGKPHLGATALALCVLQANGQYVFATEEGVKKGLRWLKRQMDAPPRGRFSGGETGENRVQDAIAALACCETYVLTGQPILRSLAESSVEFLISQRDLFEPSGERAHAPLDEGDLALRFACWSVLALVTARDGGIDDDGALARMGRFVKEQSKKAAYPEAMAVDLLRRLFDAEHDERRFPSELLERETASLSRRKPKGQVRAEDLWRWSLVSIVLAQSRDPSWKSWSHALEDVLIPLQIESGPSKGAWPPDDSVTGWRSEELYTTAMAVLCLSAERRYTFALE